MMNIYKRVFVCNFLFVAAGIIFAESFFIPFSFSIICVSICFIKVLINYFYKKSRPVFHILLCFFTGCLLIYPYTVEKNSHNEITKFTDSKKYKITGIVKKKKKLNRQRDHLIIELESVTDKRLLYPVSGRIRVTVYKNGKKENYCATGDEISFFSKIRSFSNFKNRGGFDYVRYMRFKKITATAYTKAAGILIEKKSTNTTFFEKIDLVRASVLLFIDQKEKSDSASLLKALLIGDKQSIDISVKEAFNHSGLGHVLAISGLHVGIVASFVFTFFVWFFSRFNWFLFNGLTKKAAAFITLFVVIFYGLLSGSSFSTQRAVIMVSFFLVSFFVSRKPDFLNTLSAAAFFILIIDPASIFSISFQLSFTAVLSIFAGFHFIGQKEIYKKIPKGVKAWVINFILLSLFAIIGTMPIVMYYFNIISLIGPAANIVVVPIIGFIVLPTGLFGVFILPVFPVLSGFCFHFSILILSYVIVVVKFFANIPFAFIYTITPSFLEILCYYLFCGLILLFYMYKKEDWLRKAVFYGMIAVVVVLSVDVGYWYFKRYFCNNLEVTILDVGQGSCALLELPYGYCILVDGGGFTDNTVFDMGRIVVAPFLLKKKIKTVETLILSHPNSDHLNGFLHIAENFHVKNVITNGQKSLSYGYKKFIEIIKKREINMPAFDSCPKEFEINGVKFKILYPLPGFLKGVQKYSDENNNSLVLKVEYGKCSILFSGDIMKEGEKKLVSVVKNRKLMSKILIAPHHGSKTSSSIGFLKSVKPEIVIISAGSRNRFGFPHKVVLDRYKKQGIKIFRTDLDGAVQILIDKDQSALCIRQVVTKR